MGTELPQVPSCCTLTAEGLSVQKDRAALLAPRVRRAARDDLVLELEFDADVDRALLDELIEVERGCCSFLQIDYDEGARTLRIAAPPDERAEILNGFERTLASRA